MHGPRPRRSGDGTRGARARARRGARPPLRRHAAAESRVLDGARLRAGAAGDPGAHDARFARARPRLPRAPAAAEGGRGGARLAVQGARDRAGRRRGRAGVDRARDGSDRPGAEGVGARGRPGAAGGVRDREPPRWDARGAPGQARRRLGACRRDARGRGAALAVLRRARAGVPVRARRLCSGGGCGGGPLAGPSPGAPSDATPGARRRAPRGDRGGEGACRGQGAGDEGPEEARRLPDAAHEGAPGARRGHRDPRAPGRRREGLALGRAFDPEGVLHGAARDRAEHLPPAGVARAPDVRRPAAPGGAREGES
jgi:hypothetical protein